MRSAALAVLLLLSACGTDAARSTDCADAAASPAPTPPYNDDPDLAARFPETVNGEPFEVQTYCAATMPEGGLNTAPDFLDRIGAEITDVTVARNLPPEIGATEDYASVAAWRYRGADESVVRETFLAMYAEALDEAGMDGEITEERFGGKEVHNHSSTGIFYFSDDTLYTLSGDGSTIEEVLEGLP